MLSIVPMKAYSVSKWLDTSVSDSARRALPDINQIRQHKNDKKQLAYKKPTPD